LAATYSYYIDKLVKYGQSLGLTIHKYSKLPHGTLGRICYENKWIKMDVCNAKDALQTLAHELGHYIAYSKYPNKNYEEEIDDGVRGKMKVPQNWITKKEWRNFNSLNIVQVFLER
jgi:hypothetical protein